MRYALIPFFIAIVTLPTIDAVAVADEAAGKSPRVQTLLKLTGEGDYEAAIAHVKASEGTEPVSMPYLAALVQTARKVNKAGLIEESADVYHRAAETAATLVETNPDTFGIDKAAAIWSAASRSLTAANRHSDAFSWLTLLFENDSPESAKRLAGKICLNVGAGLLDEGKLRLASQAYGRATEVLENDYLATARLGLAWTLVLAGDQDKHALTAIERFLANHENHADAPSAGLLKITCYRRLDRKADANNAIDHMLTRYGDHEAALQALVAACQSEPFAELSETVREFLVDQCERVIDSQIAGNDTDTLAAGLVASVVITEIEKEKLYAQAVAITDQSGETASRVLESLNRSGRSSDAERVAMCWISPDRSKGVSSTRGDLSLFAPDEDVEPGIEPADVDTIQKMIAKSGMVTTAGVREAACRWAGRTQRWSMLAMAAREELKHDQSVSEDTSQVNIEARIAAEQTHGRSLHVDRLFAEALLQTGNSGESLKLWQAIVDQGGATDFPTLLRLAETAVASGSVAEATSRVDAVRGRQGEGVETNLVNLLNADLLVRKLEFDQGRSMLEQVVRSSAADDNLRGRAQWMIGETYYLQEDFSEAIAAYRQVEGISDSPEWIAASLVQAGKSFEQLGRTRDAMVCYSTLVSKYGESRHAGVVRSRIAAISDDESSPNSTIRR